MGIGVTGDPESAASEGLAVAEGDANQMSGVVLDVREAQSQWGTRTLEERCATLLACRDALIDEAESLASTVVEETGKPRFEALLHEVLILADLIGYYAKQAPRILAPEVVEMHLLRYRRSYLHYAPRGVVVVIASWSLPLVGPFGVAVAALLAGNGVIVKPSDATPRAARILAQVFEAAGLPKGLLQVVSGGPAEGKALIEAEPDFVSFTGTTASGREVAAACGRLLIPNSLHLSGNGAAIVLADADLERTVNAITFGAFAHAGQLCMRIQRVFVEAAIHDEFAALLEKRVRALRLGDPGKKDTDLGRLTRAVDSMRIVEFIRDASAHGATLLVGGELPSEETTEFAPVVLLGCTEEMRLSREELLGPVLAVTQVEDASEALARVNRAGGNLIGCVFTKDRLRGRRLAEQVRSGTVMVNDALSAYATPETPFGGLGKSGVGHRHGDLGLRAMCELRHVSYDRVAMTRDAIWFPYSQRGYDAVFKAARILFRRGSPMKKLLDLF